MEEKAKTLEEVQAELAAEKQTTMLLKRRLDEQGGVKIPTKASLNKKGDPLTMTRAEQMLIDLETAIGMGPEKMAEFQEELKAAYDEGLNINEETAKGKAGKLPNVRYLIAVEAAIHRYTKRGKRKMRTTDGTGVKMKTLKKGYKKGLTKLELAFAKTLLKLMGRDPEKPAWSEDIPVPGLARLDING